MSTSPSSPHPSSTPAAPPPPAPRVDGSRGAARPPVPWWAGVLAVLGVAVVVVAVAAGATGLLLVASTRVTTQDVSASGVRTLHVTGPTGGMDVRTDPALGDRVTGRAVVRTSGREERVDLAQDGGTLRLSTTCESRGLLDRCEVGYDLTVGPDVALEVDVVTGGVAADGIGGDVDIAMTTGGVSLSSLRADEVVVAVTTGGIALEFDEAPTGVRASTTVGGVAVTVPDDGTRYAVLTGVTVGGSDVGVASDPSSTRTIDVSTTVGGVSVTYPHSP